MNTPKPLPSLIKLGRTLLFLSALALCGSAFAQEPPPQEPPAAAQVADPSDEVVGHITAMTAIVKDNIDKPELVKELLKNYLQENNKKMTEAGDRFEEKLNGLTPDEAQTYRETLQRKMEKALEDFLATMLDFSERYPEAAKELDVLLQKTVE